jgi:hypothetical protein
MRFFTFYLSTDSTVQGMIAIISKNRCSLSDCSVEVRRVFAFAFHRKRGKAINTRLLSWVLRIVATILLVFSCVRELM